MRFPILGRFLCVVHVVFAAVALAAACALASPLTAQTKPSFSRVSISGGQPYSETCSVTVQHLAGVDGPTGNVAFTNVTTGQTLGSATLGTPASGGGYARQDWPAAVNPGSLASGDINGDGHLDLLVGGIGAVSVLLGNGDDTFQAPVVTSLGSQFSTSWTNVLTGIAVGDFNGDKLPDIVVVLGNSSASNVYFMKGNGDGTFQPPILILGASVTLAIVAGDFRGNGTLDIAVATRDPSDAAQIVAMVPSKDFNG